MLIVTAGNKAGLRFQRMETCRRKEKLTQRMLDFAAKTLVKGGEVNALLEEEGSAPLRESVRLAQLLTRPQLTLDMLVTALPALRKEAEKIDADLRDEVLESVEVQIKYQGYIDRERQNADKMHRLEDVRLRPDFDYESLHALSTEARQKLTRHRPATLGQASRIPGVSPADINVLLLLLGR